MIWSVAIVTSDFKLAYNIRLALHKKYEFTHITPKEVQSAEFDLIVTTVNEFHKINVKNKIALDNSMKKNEIISRVIRYFSTEETYCHIGIDPGKSIGISIIYMGDIMMTYLTDSSKKMILWIKKQLVNLEYSSLIIKIGNGGGKSRQDIVLRVKEYFVGNVQIQEVDEKRTSIKTTSEISIHEEAAIRIARRTGSII